MKSRRRAPSLPEHVHQSPPARESYACAARHEAAGFSPRLGWGSNAPTQRLLQSYYVSATNPGSSADILTTLLDAIGDATATIDPDGVITSWNCGAEQLYGFA